jgi:hypothetical protein
MNKEIIEYNGQWHKKGKDGKCEPFTMRDLKELLKKEREQTLKEVENIWESSSKPMGDTIKHLKRKTLKQ